MSEPDRLFTDFLDEYLALHPIAATMVGEHRHDERWPDLTEAGRVDGLAFVERWLATLHSVDDAALSADAAIDRDLIVQQLEADRFADTELREETWNPLAWIYLLGEGLFPLISRNFAPLVDRLASVAGRLEGVPAVVEAAREALVGLGPDRPVGRLQTETALDQLSGDRKSVV